MGGRSSEVHGRPVGFGSDTIETDFHDWRQTLKRNELKKKRFRRDKIPSTPEMKGLTLIMGGVFLLAARLMVAPGIGSLFLLLAAVFLTWGMARWGRRVRRFPMGVLCALVLIPCAVIEIIGFTLSGGWFAFLEGAAYIAGTAASVVLALLTFEYCRTLVRGKSEKVEGILAQRRWWVGVGYVLCGGWAMLDGFTGLLPNVGVIMRVVSILVDVFFLSALFQARRAVIDADQPAPGPAPMKMDEK